MNRKLRKTLKEIYASEKPSEYPAFLKEILAKQICPANSYLITGTENPAEPRTMQNRFKAILKYSGVRIVNFHVLRHT